MSGRFLTIRIRRESGGGKLDERRIAFDQGKFGGKSMAGDVKGVSDHRIVTNIVGKGMSGMIQRKRLDGMDPFKVRDVTTEKKRNWPQPTLGPV